MFGNQKRVEHHLFEKYSPIAKMVFRQHYRFGGINQKFKENFIALNYELFTKKGQISAITYNPKTIVLAQKKFKDTLIRVLQVNDRQFLYLKRKKKTFLVEDKNETLQNPKIFILLVFAIILITLILSFIVTLRKLKPLKILKEKVGNLGDENFDFECCDTSRKDEVSQLGMEFKKTARKLKDIKEARNVFIRNIMHELKTPITKGKFLTEIERNEQNDEKLKEVFNRLEALINEFASIEELISSAKNIEKNHYFLDDLIDNAKDSLMLEDDVITGHFVNKKLEVNFKLFSIAVKNLIDNAIKYSPDKKVNIETEDEDVIFLNSGEKLKHDLEKYYEPFFANEEKIQNSFGLGLYIVHNILKANNYSLTYEHKDGINIFRCKKDK
jgi:two-component system OmpR family sensor kinase